MPTGRHHPRLSPFSFPHDFKTSPRFRNERSTVFVFVIFVPKKLLFHLIPFIYGTPENRTFRPENGSFSQSTHSWRSTVNGSFSQSTHSWSSTVFVGFFRRIHDGKPLRLRPRPSASILNVKQNLPHFQKKWLSARSTP